MTHLAILVLLFAAAAPQEAPKVQRVSGGVLAGKVIEKPQPVYPAVASAAEVEGAVVVEVTVGEDGKVMSARAVSGHPLLRDAAVEAAQRWTFTPTRIQGHPVRVIGTITFNFRLADAEASAGAPVGLSTDEAYARMTSGFACDYPDEAERDGVEGMVQVRVTISRQGRVLEAEALSGPEALREASVAAAKRARFRAVLGEHEPSLAEADIYYLFAAGASEGRLVQENGDPVRVKEGDAERP
jgi:TonB family protein